MCWLYFCFVSLVNSSSNHFSSSSLALHNRPIATPSGLRPYFSCSKDQTDGATNPCRATHLTPIHRSQFFSFQYLSSLSSFTMAASISSHVVYSASRIWPNFQWYADTFDESSDAREWPNSDYLLENCPVVSSNEWLRRDCCKSLFSIVCTILETSQAFYMTLCSLQRLMTMCKKTLQPSCSAQKFPVSKPFSKYARQWPWRHFRKAGSQQEIECSSHRPPVSLFWQSWHHFEPMGGCRLSIVYTVETLFLGHEIARTTSTGICHSKLDGCLPVSRPRLFIYLRLCHEFRVMLDSSWWPIAFHHKRCGHWNQAQITSHI